MSKLNNHTVAIVKAKHDIYRPDFFGPGDAYEYCVENGLFHLAYKEGELFVFDVSRFDISYLTDTSGKRISTTKALGIKLLNDFITFNNISNDISLIKAMSLRNEYVCQHPTTKELELVELVDGDISFKDFLIKYGGK